MPTINGAPVTDLQWRAVADYLRLARRDPSVPRDITGALLTSTFPRDRNRNHLVDAGDYSRPDVGRLFQRIVPILRQCRIENIGSEPSVAALITGVEETYGIHLNLDDDTTGLFVKDDRGELYLHVHDSLGGLRKYQLTQSQVFFESAWDGVERAPIRPLNPVADADPLYVPPADLLNQIQRNQYTETLCNSGPNVCGR